MATALAAAADRPRPVAPWWHTGLLLGLFVAMAIGGARYQGAALSQPAAQAEHPRVAPLYLGLLLMEWALLYYVWKGGLRRAGVRMRDLVGGRWSGPRDVLRDIVLALAVWGVWKGLSLVSAPALGPDRAASIDQMLPRGPIEIPLWIALSITAGICEEVVFRGYLQRQFEALTGSRGLAWLLQAAVFGISHGYQGVMACLRIAAYGGLFGLLALWRRSLRPGMLAHALTDVLAGLFRL